MQAEETCSARDAEAATIRAYAIEGCEGSVFLGASATLPGARAEAHWERDESAGYTSFGLAAPPRYVMWHEDEHGCTFDLGLAGAMRHDCPASPPAPVLP